MLNLLAEIVIIIFTIVLTVRFIVRATLEGREYLCSVWCGMEVMKLMAACIAVGVYVLRTLMIKSHIEEMKNNRGELSVSSYVKTP